MADDTEVTEQELLRQYRTKAAELMGQYLLRGYKMLADHCPQCTTVLLQSREGALLCVLCQELLANEQRETEKAIVDSTAVKPQKPVPSTPPSYTQTQSISGSTTGDSDVFHWSEEVLLKKIASTTRELQEEQSIERSRHLCHLLSASFDALMSLHKLNDLRNVKIANPLCEHSFPKAFNVDTTPN